MSDIKAGEIVLITGGPNFAFYNCLAVVDEAKKWGIQAYVSALGQDRFTVGGDQAYIRLAHTDYVRTGGTIPPDKLET